MLSSSPGKESAFRVTSGRLQLLCCPQEPTFKQAGKSSGQSGESIDGSWDLGPLAAKLAPGHISPPTREYKEPKGTKNNHVPAILKGLLTPNIQRDQQTHCHF